MSRADTFAFASATFLGAFLLFLVQPLVARYILPWFGGGPAVWTTCMLFFQAALLAGYAYAHFSAAKLSPRAQAAAHVALLVAAVLTALPLSVSERWKPAGSGGELSPAWQILALLAVSVGPAALALSATSPLLNAWFSRAHPGAGPAVYRLYAVSNAGSLLALLGYPFGVEPLLTRRQQSLTWSAGLVTFAALCTYCAARASRRKNVLIPFIDGPPAAAPPPVQRFLWLVLPAVASVLLLATTNTMTQDVAAAPFLWVLPLALYLLTFILAFEGRRSYRRIVFGPLLAMSAAAACWVLFRGDNLSMLMRLGVLSAVLFVCCMVCHGELAALKPPPRHLTAYYLTISAGGALGGLLVAVVAPLVLDRYLELHAGLWLCCLLAVILPRVTGREATRPGYGQYGALDVLNVAGLLMLAVALWMAANPVVARTRVVHRSRDFYGVLTVFEYRPTDGERGAFILHHAGVTHGHQFVAADKRHLPTSYYSPQSGVGLAIQAIDALVTGRGRRVGVVGLGAGTVAAYGRSGDVFRFYELNPSVAKLARQRFTYLRDSKATCEIVLGDARISLEREPPGQFDLLVLDAFSGDAIPAHLLTAEAFELYRRHLAPGGVVAVHISNNYLDLEPVLAAQAEHGTWHAVAVSNRAGDDTTGVEASDWVLLSADASRLAFAQDAGSAPQTLRGLRLWTDEYTSLFPILK
jgi:hypothetical protein